MCDHHQNWYDEYYYVTEYQVDTSNGVSRTVETGKRSHYIYTTKH